MTTSLLILVGALCVNNIAMLKLPGLFTFWKFLGSIK